MQNSTNMRILELLRFLYERTDENHPATVSDLSLIHILDNKENFAENTKLCAAILTGPQSTEEGGEVCTCLLYTSRCV